MGILGGNLVRRCTLPAAVAAPRTLVLQLVGAPVLLPLFPSCLMPIGCANDKEPYALSSAPSSAVVGWRFRLYCSSSSAVILGMLEVLYLAPWSIRNWKQKRPASPLRECID